MAVRKTGQSASSAPSATTSKRVEERLIAFAEQLGSLVGTVQSKAEGWLDSEALSREVARIRDSASDLLDQVTREAPQRKAAVKKPAPSVPREAAPVRKGGRGPVDAPGKRHRQPPPHERLDKRMGEPTGKKMGQKSIKMGNRRGRG